MEGFWGQQCESHRGFHGYKKREENIEVESGTHRSLSGSNITVVLGRDVNGWAVVRRVLTEEYQKDHFAMMHYGLLKDILEPKFFRFHCILNPQIGGDKYPFKESMVILP